MIHKKTLSAHFIMERKMMLEIRQRAERRLMGLPAAA